MKKIKKLELTEQEREEIPAVFDETNQKEIFQAILLNKVFDELCDSDMNDVTAMATSYHIVKCITESFYGENLKYYPDDEERLNMVLKTWEDIFKSKSHPLFSSCREEMNIGLKCITKVLQSIESRTGLTVLYH